MTPTGGAGVLITFKEGDAGVRAFHDAWVKYQEHKNDVIGDSVDCGNIESALALADSLDADLIDSIVEVHEMQGNPFIPSEN